MAHECPECGFNCHCGGDIDDIDFGDLVASCTHCPNGFTREGDEDDDDFYDTLDDEIRSDSP